MDKDAMRNVVCETIREWFEVFFDDYQKLPPNLQPLFLSANIREQERDSVSMIKKHFLHLLIGDITNRFNFVERLKDVRPLHLQGWTGKDDSKSELTHFYSEAHKIGNVHLQGENAIGCSLLPIPLHFSMHISGYGVKISKTLGSESNIILVNETGERKWFPADTDCVTLFPPGTRGLFDLLEENNRHYQQEIQRIVEQHLRLPKV